MTLAAPTVLHVETGMHLYGGALQVFYLLRGLAEAGWRNVLVCSEGSAIAEAAAGFVTRVHAVPMSGDLDFKFIGRLRDIVRAEAPDLIHLHSRRGADVLGGIAARLEKVPVVLSRRVDNPEPKWVARLKYRLFDQVVTISNGIRDVLLSEGVPPDKVVCVHSAVDAERYRPGGDRAWFDREFGLAADDQAVGMVAQLIPRKGHRYLLNVVPRILQSCPNARFLLFGKGPLEAELRERIAAAGLQDQVRLAGFRDDLDRILPCLDLLVHPAEMEGLGVSLLQAAASGVPLVGTAAGGIPEIVRDGQTGLLIPPADEAALADAVIVLLRDRERARAMGRAGRDLVEREFSIPAMVEGNMEVYQALLARVRRT